MNSRILSTLAAALLLGVPLAPAQDLLPVRGVASVSESEVILDVFIDSGVTSLRGFGFQLVFDSDDLALTSGGRYDGLWFLRGENNVNYPYTDVTEPDRGRVRVVGGRLDGDNPGAGVAGKNLILATLVFKRLNGNAPEFEMQFAGSDPYINFASEKGESLDRSIDFQKVELQVAPEDRDGDGLPDNYELATFGNLTTSDGSTDTDSDGDDDQSEWLHGTDPTDPNSKFVLQVVPQGDGSKLVIWTGRLGRVYDLEWSTDLRSFNPLASGIPGIDPLIEHLDALHNSDPEGFYRVKTKFPTLGR